MRLLKPSKLDRLGRKNLKRLAKARAKRLEQEEHRFIEQIARVAIYNRDGGRCRVCGMKLFLSSRDPFKVMHKHHVKYRSAGGEDTMENQIAICPKCHQQEHWHTLSLTGTAGRLKIKWLVQ